MKMKNKKEAESKVMYMPICMSIGLSVGVALGAALNNIPTFMCIGMSIGLGIGAMIDAQKRKKEGVGEQEEECEKKNEGE